MQLFWLVAAIFIKEINIFFAPENLKEKLLIISPDFFFITGPAAQTAKKQKFRTTKSP